MKYIVLLAILGFGLMSYISKNQYKTNDTIFFERFESKFPLAPLPYAITVPSASYNPYFTMGSEASNFIPEMEYSRFSRMTRSNGTYNAKLLKTSKYSLLVYTMEETVSDTLSPVHTTMATFDSTGKRIDYIDFACQCSPDMFKTGTIDKQLNIVIKQFRNIWMYDPQAKGYAGNEVVRHELIENVFYSLDEKGHFNISNPFTKAHEGTRF